MRAAIYARVSTADQAEEGTSLGTQLDSCRTQAAARGWTVAGEYVDAGVSGAKDSRPELDRLMADAQAGLIDVIVFTKLDRFSRSMAHLTAAVEQLGAWGVELVSLGEAIDTGGPLGDLMRNMLGSFAQYERRLINQRTMEGLTAAAKAGGWPGGPPPFGLRRVRDADDRHTRLEIDEVAAATIREAARLLLTGISPPQVATELNALGMKPQRSTRWSNTMVRRMLLCAHLGGTLIYNKPGKNRKSNHESIEVACPAILDQATLAELRLRIEARSIGPKADAKVYPLTGRLLGECGARYHGIYREDRDRRSYRCMGARWRADSSPCGDHYIAADRVEEQVWRVVCELLGDPERLARLAAGHLGPEILDTGAPVETLADLDARVVKAERQLATSMVEWSKVGMDSGAIAAATAELNAELGALRARRDRAVTWQADAEVRTAQLSRLQLSAAAAAERLPSMPAAERKQVFQLLDVRVRVTDWSCCDRCFGTGRVSDGSSGGIACSACSGNRWVPTLRVTGVVHDAFLAAVGDQECEMSRRCRCS